MMFKTRCDNYKWGLMKLTPVVAMAFWHKGGRFDYNPMKFLREYLTHENRS